MPIDLLDLFFIVFFFDFFIIFYFIYNFIDTKILHNKQGAKLKIKINN